MVNLYWIKILCLLSHQNWSLWEFNQRYVLPWPLDYVWIWLQHPVASKSPGLNYKSSSNWTNSSANGSSTIHIAERLMGRTGCLQFRFNKWKALWWEKMSAIKPIFFGMISRLPLELEVGSWGRPCQECWSFSGYSSWIRLTVARSCFSWPWMN